MRARGSSRCILIPVESPRSGNNDEIHGRAWNVIKYIMDGTRFDVMDLIIREIATSKGDKTKSIYFAPYIMKLILSKIDFTEVCDVEHKEYQPRVAPPQAPPPPPPAPIQPSEQITDTQSHPGQQASQARPCISSLFPLLGKNDDLIILLTTLGMGSSPLTLPCI